MFNPLKLLSSFFRMPIIDNFVRIYFLPAVVWCYLHIVHITSKIILINEHYYNELEKNNLPYVFAVWHGRQFSPLYYHRNKKITVLVSPSRDGNVQAAFLKFFGFLSIRGSSDKQPVKSIITLIKTAKKEKCNFAFAVDGPKGPIYKVKPGIAAFAAKTGYNIIPITTAAKRKIILKTWDNCIIPLPFNRIKIIYGKPITVDSAVETELYAQKIENTLLELDKI